MSQVDRRAFLQRIGALGTASAMVPASAAGAQPAAAAQAAPAPAPPPAYTFFSPPEAAFVEAAVDQLIPADDLTPGGTACGVAIFIDRQLAGAWGAGERLYLSGPWRTGTPEQGYQLPMTPAELYRAGIAAANRYCVQTHAREFDRLPADQQVAVLRGLEQGAIALGGVPARTFFETLLQNAMEGFFADPLYGGNRDKASWRMLGYPGVIAVYAEDIRNYRNKPYNGEPTSIQDLI
jgi:gluconate 2-dehydrogenase gamma chain